MNDDVTAKPRPRRPASTGKSGARVRATGATASANTGTKTGSGASRSVRHGLAARIGGLTAGEAAPTPAGAALQHALTRARQWLAAASRQARAHTHVAVGASAHFGRTWLAPRLAAGGRAALHGGRTGMRLAIAGGQRGLRATLKGGRHGKQVTVEGARQGLQASAAFTRERAIPWMKRRASDTRERLRPAELHKDYRRFLRAFHRTAFDRDVEQLLFAPTRPRRRLLAWRRPAEDAPADEAPDPTPRRVFGWAMHAIPEPVTRFTFVDLGAGRGRTLLLAATFDFERIVGVEPDPALHNDCEMNIAQFPRSRMQCRDVTCVLGEIGSVDLPEEKAVFHVFGAPAKDELEKVLGRIAESYTRAPRRLYMICLGAGGAESVARQPIFEPLPLDFLPHHRLRLLSPYPVAIFRSIV